MKEEIEVASRSERSQGLVHVTEGRDLNLHLVFCGELVDNSRTQVLLPVVDSQGCSDFWLESVFQGRVVVVDRQRDRGVRSRKLGSFVSRPALGRGRARSKSSESRQRQ